jgi:hypothetical protein
MRIILLTLLSAVCAFGQADYTSLLLLHNRVAAAGCTVATGNFFNESFEGTGYDESGSGSWSETAGTPNEDAALPGTSPCTGLGSQCLDANYPSGGARQFISYPTGEGTPAAQATTYFRFYFYVDVFDSVSTDNAYLFSATESTTDPALNMALRVAIRDNAGQLTAYATASSGSTAQNISLDTWYRVEVKWVFNSTGGSIFRIYNAAGTQIGTDATFNTVNNERRNFHMGIIGADNTKNCRVYFDGFGVSSTDWLGQ